MAKRRIFENVAFDPTYLDLSTWPQVLLDGLEGDKKEIFLRRKQAVEMYMNPEISLAEIFEKTGIPKNRLLDFVKRCLSLDNSGIIWGFRALIPQKKIKNFDPIGNPTNISKNTHPFQHLLSKYPSIKETIDKCFFGSKEKKATDPIMSVKDIHLKFLDACRTTGLSMGDYPFTLQDLGKRAVYRYVSQLEKQHAIKAANRYGEETARHLANTGVGVKNTPQIIKPFQRVEFDGHRIDAILTVKFTNIDGDECVEVMERIWLLVILDVATRVVLGYHLCLHSQYSASDVLECIRNAVMPWKPKELTIPGLKYPENGGFASLVVPQTQWAIWDEFSYDNGKANLAKIVSNRLTDFVGCALNPGPVNMPEKRTFIERFFGILEENGYHRLVNTVGDSPSDPRRKQPEKMAKKYEISVDEIEQLTEVLIARYNREPHRGLSYLCPLEALEQRVMNKLMIPRILPEEKRNELDFLSFSTTRVVRGGIKQGKRPYVTFEGVEYRNDILANSFDLVNSELHLLVNVKDISSVRVFLEDGSDFGYLTASGKWGSTPHTLQMRKQINRLIRRKLLYVAFSDNPIDAFHRFLEEKASNNKKYRNTLAAAQKYHQEHLKPQSETDDKDQNKPEKKATNQPTINNGGSYKTSKREKDFDLKSLRDKFKTINL